MGDPDQPIGNGVALWFETDDFDAVVVRIREAPVEVVTDVHVNPNAGHREIWIRDLDGYLVVFAEAPVAVPGAQHPDRLSAMTEPEFQTVVESVNGGRAAAARLPFDSKTVFGRARAPVHVAVMGGEPFRTTIASYGGVGWIGFRKAQLADLGLSVGDQVTLRVELDDQPREVEVPAELTAALAVDREAEAVFQGLSFTHRQEYARWVGEAKRSETRDSRAAKAIRMLREGIRTPD